jgi:hypothetical protein
MSTRTARTRRRATYEDLIAVPDHMVAEILDGELVVSPRPAPRHANAASVIGMDVGGAFHRRTGSPGGPGGWWILDEPELHLGDDVLVPDLAGWRRSRWNVRTVRRSLPDRALACSSMVRPGSRPLQAAAGRSRRSRRGLGAGHVRKGCPGTREASSSLFEKLRVAWR